MMRDERAGVEPRAGFSSDFDAPPCQACVAPWVVGLRPGLVVNDAASPDSGEVP